MMMVIILYSICISATTIEYHKNIYSLRVHNQLKETITIYRNANINIPEEYKLIRILSDTKLFPVILDPFDKECFELTIDQNPLLPY